MPFNFDFLANVIFFIIGIYNIIYLFLVVINRYLKIAKYIICYKTINFPELAKIL